MRALSSVLVPLLVGCSAEPAQTASIPCDGATFTALVAEGHRSQALDALDPRLSLLEAEIALLSRPGSVEHLDAVDRERVEILTRAAEAARTDLDALGRSRADGDIWRSAAISLADRLDAIDRGIDRVGGSGADGSR